MSNIEEDREFLTSLARKYFKYETPNPGQIEAAVEAVRLFRSGIKHVILQAPTGCHAKGHKILMYDGSLKKIEDIVIGDTVMGPNSEPKRVLDLVRGRQEMRRIIPKNGSSFVVNKDHKINSYVTCQGKEKWESSKEEVISIAQYESSSKWFRHIHKLQRKSVEFNESNQTIHPYILGILIGDGTLCKKNIMLTNADIEVQEIFKSYLKQLDLTYSVNVRTVNIPCEHIGVSDPMSTWKVPNRFTEMIKSLGLYGTKSENKFIPFNYKIASREQRLELFAGLLDTDGHLPNNSNCFEYSTASKQLGDDIAFLARSLGFMVSMNSKDSYYIKDGVKIKCQKAYRIHISGDLNLIPTKVKRKVGSSRKQIKNHLVCGFEVENLPVDDYYGMTLDGDHLYLDEEFVVHHNCGKSEISHVVHKMMRHLKDNHRTTILTASKGLQDQLVEDYKDMFDLKGRANYSCPYDKAPYNSGACRAHVNRGACKKNVECPYIIRRIQWCNKAEIRTTNNSFQIEAPPEICMKPENKANLIIIDECDTIDDAITEHTSINLYAQEFMSLAQYGKGEFMNQVKETIDLFGRIKVGEPFQITEELHQSLREMGDTIDDLLNDFEEMLKNAKRTDQDIIGNIIESLQKIADKSVMLDGAVGGQWIINEYDPGRSILIKPIFAWQVADYALFRKADQFLHMSATICGFDAYAGVLGLKEGEFECLEIPNPIPVANRRVYVVANQKISGNYDIKKLASDVDKLILRHGEQNGIIHTVSYKLANELYVNSSLKHRMLVSKDREEIMNELKQVNTGRIVLSAGFVRGFDFKGDMSRYQIQLKVPFDFLGDPLVKLNAERRGDWYARSAILKLVQSCGRSIRGVDDYATTYIMDMNFKRLYSQNRDLFPSWFCDSVVMKPE